jgi:hypothetical protein
LPLSTHLSLKTIIFGAITWFGSYLDEMSRFIVFLMTLLLRQMWISSFFRTAPPF